MTESEMTELVQETATAMAELSKFIKDGPQYTIDDLFDLSGLLHFIGNRLGTLSIQCPEDERLTALLEQCASLQAQTIEQAQAMAQLARGASIH